LNNNKCRKCEIRLKKYPNAKPDDASFVPVCRVKAKSEEARDELNSKLFQLKLGGYIVNQNCELIDSGNQAKCPEFEQT